YKGSGTTVTVLGSNFVEGTTVRLGDTTISNVQIISQDRLRFTIPEDFDSNGVVSITIDNGYDSAELLHAFTFESNAVPNISNVSPNSGGTKGGIPVTISGTNFRQDIGPTPPTVVFI